MQQILEARSEALRQLCEKHGVRRLELFGSAASGDFDADGSDLDFVAEFNPMSPVEHADASFGLQEDLESLFDRPVDLVELSAVNNPYFLQAIEDSGIVMYEAA
ncbi:MAG: hypothetical protein GY719_08890 [bacterium]|nr:hypothetical protein [bacterium]